MDGKKNKCMTYMSVVDEPMFAGNLMSFFWTPRYVDSPCVRVDLLAQHWSELRHQQDQQRPEYQLQQPEPVAYRGRWRAQSHGFLLVQHGL